MNDKNQPRRLHSTTIAQGDWLRLEEVSFVDQEGHNRTWETSTRLGERGAVYMVTQLRPSDRYVFVKQYRPSPNAEVLEFPAGLIDPDEDPADTAVRELQEETGYRGTLKWLANPSLSSPGMTGEKVYLVMMDVDEEHQANIDPNQDCDEGEHIEVLIKSPEEIEAFLKECETAGIQLDSRLAAYFLAQGLRW